MTNEEISTAEPSEAMEFANRYRAQLALALVFLLASFAVGGTLLQLLRIFFRAVSEVPGDSIKLALTSLPLMYIAWVLMQVSLGGLAKAVREIKTKELERLKEEKEEKEDE